MKQREARASCSAPSLCPLPCHATPKPFARYQCLELVVVQQLGPNHVRQIGELGLLLALVLMILLKDLLHVLAVFVRHCVRRLVGA